MSNDNNTLSLYLIHMRHALFNPALEDIQDPQLKEKIAKAQHTINEALRLLSEANK